MRTRKALSKRLVPDYLRLLTLYRESKNVMTFIEFCVAKLDQFPGKFRQVFLTPIPNSGPVAHVIPPLPVYSQAIDTQPAWDERMNFTGACDPVYIPAGINNIVTEIPTVYNGALDDQNWY